MNFDAAFLIDTSVLIDGIVVDGAGISILTMFEPAGGIDSVADPAVRAARNRRYDVAASVVDSFPVSGRVLGGLPRHRRCRGGHRSHAEASAAGPDDRGDRSSTRAHELLLVTSNLDDYRGLEALPDLRSP